MISLLECMVCLQCNNCFCVVLGMKFTNQGLVINHSDWIRKSSDYILSAEDVADVTGSEFWKASTIKSQHLNEIFLSNFFYMQNSVRYTLPKCDCSTLERLSAHLVGLLGLLVPEQLGIPVCSLLVICIRFSSLFVLRKVWGVWQYLKIEKHNMEKEGCSGYFAGCEFNTSNYNGRSQHAWNHSLCCGWPASWGCQ